MSNRHKTGGVRITSPPYERTAFAKAVWDRTGPIENDHNLLLDWERAQAPPQGKSKRQPQAVLLAAVFFFDGFPQYPLSNFREYCGRLSIFLFPPPPSNKNLPNKWELFTKYSYFIWKWRPYFPHGPPPKSPDLIAEPIPTFRGAKMNTVCLPQIFRRKFEEWAKNWPVSFLPSPQENRRGEPDEQPK